MRRRTRPRHRTREWEYGGWIYPVDQDFTDEILLRVNHVIPAIGGEVRSVCIGHAPSELALNGGQNTGGGTEYGHMRFAIPESWPWLPILVSLSHIPDTSVTHTVNYTEGHQQSAYVELTCLIAANTRNLKKRLQWWNTLLKILDSAVEETN